MKKIVFTIFAIAFSFLWSSAQSIHPSIINSNGGTTNIAGNTYEWSIGEMVLVNTATAGSIVVTQGLLQPGKPTSGSAVSESQFIFDHVSIYPNPSEQVFFLSADFNKKGLLKSTLYDINGKIVENKEKFCNGEKLKIEYNISALSAGNYMLIVSFESENNRTIVNKAAYKIEKLN